MPRIRFQVPHIIYFTIAGFEEMAAKKEGGRPLELVGHWNISVSAIVFANQSFPLWLTRVYFVFFVETSSIFFPAWGGADILSAGFDSWF